MNNLMIFVSSRFRFSCTEASDFLHLFPGNRKQNLTEQSIYIVLRLFVCSIGIGNVDMMKNLYNTKGCYWQIYQLLFMLYSESLSLPSD